MWICLSNLTIQVRRPLHEGDLGEMAFGRYTFEDGIVTLVDENGTPLRRGHDQALTTRTVKGARDAPVWFSAVLAGQDAHQVAARLLHNKVSSQRSGTDFNRPLPPGAPGVDADVCQAAARSDPAPKAAQPFNWEIRPRLRTTESYNFNKIKYLRFPASVVVGDAISQ